MAPLSLHLSKCHIVGNLMHWLITVCDQLLFPNRIVFSHLVAYSDGEALLKFFLIDLSFYSAKLSLFN